MTKRHTSSGPRKRTIFKYAAVHASGDADERSSRSASSSAHDLCPSPRAPWNEETVKKVGAAAYLWGWPLVNLFNRAKQAKLVTKISNPIIIGGAPIAYGTIGMLTNYIKPEERVVSCPNHDVVYGSGVFDNLDDNPIVFQVPKFDDRFWVYAFYDARTDEFGTIGQPYGSEPGFYLLVGPNWKQKKPDGIKEVVPSPTNLAIAIPRIFQNDTPEDHDHVQQYIRQINFYPLKRRFDKTCWRIQEFGTVPKRRPCPQTPYEFQFVNPRTFFKELPTVLDRVCPLPGEKERYECYRRLLKAAKGSGTIRRWLREAAYATEDDPITKKFMQWSWNGHPVETGWNTCDDNGQWGNDYVNRTATAKSNIFENRPTEAKYFYTDHDRDGNQLVGNNLYTITFDKGKLPPVNPNGFWSLTLYNSSHFFYLNPQGRYSLGTNNLVVNPKKSLTLYVGASCPGNDNVCYWLPAPDQQPFSLFFRTYWPTPEILDGTWIPPEVRPK